MNYTNINNYDTDLCRFEKLSWNFWLIAENIKKLMLKINQIIPQVTLHTANVHIPNISNYFC